MSTTKIEYIFDQIISVSENVIGDYECKFEALDTGIVTYVGESVARVGGLSSIQSEELIRFPGNNYGLAFNLDPGVIGVVMLDKSNVIEVGDEARRTNRVADVPVGEDLLGRVVDAVGRPLDGKSSLPNLDRMPIERDAPGIMDREPVEVPLQTGLKVVDSLIPIGRGQRELILGDRQTGKTAITVDTIINQKDKDVICIYCAIGQKSSDIVQVISELERRGAKHKSIVVAADGEDPPGLIFITPYAATTIGEYFRDKGRDVLIVYDDLTKHARAYRELSLLLRRPPAREAYPGDIFYIHSRLLERATHLHSDKGGGSLTALPIVETHAQNISAYIPTNLISITDGQIYLNPQLHSKGILPAVDVGKSVSRVGGKTQLPAYRKVAGDLRLSYSQFEELESFARFSTRLDEETRKKLERGKRVREIFKQPQYSPLPAPQQIAALIAINRGLLDDLPLEKISDAEKRIVERFDKERSDLTKKILEGEELNDDDMEMITETLQNALESLKETDGDS
ncbi:MAG: alternate F1F0 ATPase, F1 subunit alpha [candidate division Zixibacteria bacterium]|nr:alternate F1F0 ATPase, F1 subunit alpha [candidate division Zixibacteria bacterium]